MIQSFSLFSTQGQSSHQEDFVLGKKERGLFVVADGFGGIEVGSMASQVACESVLQFLEKKAGDAEATLPFVLKNHFSLAGNVLFNSLVHANRQVFRLNQKKSVNEKGGASVLAGFVDGDLLALGSVGGCSAWIQRGDRTIELVTPRTYARMCNPFDQDPNPQLAIPLMALGISEELEPEMIEFRVLPGDQVLLHSDGFRKEVREEVFQLFQSGPNTSIETITGSMEALLEEKAQGGGFTDNASMILIQF